MSKIARLPAPAHAAAAETPSLAVSDLTVSGDEPRILDLSLAGRLGFVQPRDIRKIIERNKAELEGYGNLWHGATNSKEVRKQRLARIPRHRGAVSRRGPAGREYHLNEGQALLICALARTSMAARIRRELITVFMEYRRGTLPSPQPAPEPVVIQPDVTAILATVSTLADQLQALCKGETPPRPEARREVAPLQEQPVKPATGLLYGVLAIARHMRLKDMQVRHLQRTHGLPVFKIGKTVCASPEVLDNWIAIRAFAGEAR